MGYGVGALFTITPVDQTDLAATLSTGDRERDAFH
jgi:hypothetical protein